MELDEREAHCVARLIQGALFGEHNLFDGYNYCKYRCDKHTNLAKSMYARIRKRLTEETGVDLDFTLLDKTLAHFDFPQHKFLANANPEVMKYFGVNYA